MRNSYSLIPLRQYLGSGDVELLDRLIEEFSCSKDKQVEAYLKRDAIQFDRSNIARTYLFVNDDDECPDKSNIVAYFTLAVTVTDYSGISKSRRAKFLGNIYGRNTQDFFGGLLIAQLARNDNYGTQDVNGQELIETCEEILSDVNELVGGRVIYLDCKEPLIALYESCGYRLLQAEPFSNGLYKMMKMLPKNY
jgi:hypothetical protein